MSADATHTSTSTPATESTRMLPPLDMRPAYRGLREQRTIVRRDALRLRRASWAFTTRRVPKGAASSVLPREGKPRSGDLVLARVDLLGHHGALQLVTGRRRTLFPGDEVVVAYGHRYASGQFESQVPESMGPCHLVAGGGLASRARSWHDKISRGPTEITPIGLVADSRGRRMNLRDYALEPVRSVSGRRPTAIAVVGTSMDSGKTQTCAHLVRGLIAGGSRIGYAKITGTGAGGDYWLLHDAGADPVLDFTDIGYPSTYMLSTQDVVAALRSLVDQVANHGVDAMVLEIADGILQGETTALLEDPAFSEIVSGIVLAAYDSMGAAAGYQWLQKRNMSCLALSGMLTAAPLQVREARQATGLEIYDRDELSTRHVAVDLLRRAQKQHAARRHPFYGVPRND